MGDDGRNTWYGKLNHWDPGAEGHQWDNRGGRVTLVGDAAHSMTFQRGQDLNHAITGAVALRDRNVGAWKVEVGMLVMNSPVVKSGLDQGRGEDGRNV